MKAITCAAAAKLAAGLAALWPFVSRKQYEAVVESAAESLAAEARARLEAEDDAAGFRRVAVAFIAAAGRLAGQLDKARAELRAADELADLIAGQLETESARCDAIAGQLESANHMADQFFAIMNRSRMEQKDTTERLRAAEEKLTNLDEELTRFGQATWQIYWGAK